jgi:hypothetical protein
LKRRAGGSPFDCASYRLVVEPVGGLVTGARREIADMRDLISLGRRQQTRPRGLLPLAGGTLADVSAQRVCHGVAAVDEMAVADGLVEVRRPLVSVSAGLVAVRARLLGV